MSVYQKLSEARAKFHTIKLQKTGHNKFAGYNYFELGDFLIPALSVFKEVGLLSVISFGKDAATMRIIDMDKPDDLIVIESPMSSAALKGAHDIQNLGAVQTYLRRYLWVAALEIVEHDAIDSSAGKKEEKSFRSSPTMGALEALPVDEQPFIRDLADEVKDHVTAGRTGEAYMTVEGAALDDGQKVALWSLLDSKTRAAIKKAGQALKEAA